MGYSFFLFFPKTSLSKSIFYVLSTSPRLVQFLNSAIPWEFMRLILWLPINLITGSPKFVLSSFVSLPWKLDILYYHISCCKNQAYRCLCIFVYNHQKMCVTILYIWCQEFVYRLCSSVYNILKKK